MRREEAYKKIKNLGRPFKRVEALELGINDSMLRALIHDGKINRSSQGVYIISSDIPDTEYILQQKFKKCIISHESALYHHGYSERTPEKISVTIPKHYGTSRLKGRNLRIRYVNKELHEYGLIVMKSNYGNLINVYNLERTICDVVRSERSMDAEIVNKALRKYIKENKNRLAILMLYAKKMSISKKMSAKIGVLL
jgi:predicted transcriptional regulator of viral defense system